jgi:hypothetical protein
MANANAPIEPISPCASRIQLSTRPFSSVTGRPPTRDSGRPSGRPVSDRRASKSTYTDLGKYPLTVEDRCAMILS